MATPTTPPRTSVFGHLRACLVITVMLTVVVCGIYPVVVWGLAQAFFPYQANGSLITAKDGTVIGSALLGQPFSGPGYFHPRPSAAGNGYDPTSSGGSNLGPTSAKLICGDTKAAPPPAPDASATAAASPATAAAATPVDATAANAAAAAPANATAAATLDATAAAAVPQVVDFDGITLRVLHYCDDNGIPFAGIQDGKAIDLTPYRTSDGWDEVKLITAFNDGDHPVTIKAGMPIPADAVTASASGLDPHISVANALLQARRVAKARGIDEATVRSLIVSSTEGSGGFFGDPGVNVLRLNLALDARK
jgi:K+-transporting ATPase ATPase C chain